MASSRLRCIAALFFFAGLGAAQQLAINEPADPNQILLGAWIDSNSTTDGADSPAVWNQRIGQRTSVFQLAQNIPLLPFDVVTGTGGPAPEYLLEQTLTDAAIMLTVYPTTLDLSLEDYTTLGYQLSNYTDVNNRACFLRFAPEMQGTWNAAYGFQPIAFKQMWLTMYPIIKSIAPKCAIVWAPNEGLGYPFSQPPPANATEAAALITSNTGETAVSAADDPFSPFYPGDDYVDWIGMSVYYKGPDYKDQNVPQGANFCADLIQNIDPNTNLAGVSNFYQTYCTKPGKACMFSESGAAYHVYGEAGGTADQTQMMSAWWQNCITNPAMFQQRFPRLRMIMQFEFEKYETASNGTGQDLRDYRLANDTDVLASFSSDLAAFATNVQWANSRALTSGVPSTGIPSTVLSGPTTSVCTKYCGQVVFHTARIIPTGPPALFGTTRASSATQLKASIAVGVSTVGITTLFSFLSRSARNARRAGAQ